MSFLLIKADVRRPLPMADGSVHCVVTSPPYWGLRDYGVDGQIGLEKTPEEFVEKMVGVFREVKRVLRDEGTLWLNMGDCFSSTPPGCKGVSQASGLNGVNSASGTYRKRLEQGHGQKRDTSKIPGIKPKDLVGVPWMLAFALRADGWYLRQEIIWDKPNAMPESVRDRPSRAHEQVFLLSKSARYYYDEVAERRPQKTLGRRHEGKSGYREGHPSKGGIASRALNPLGGAVRSVWRISSKSYKGAHFATMPGDLAARCIRLGSSARGCCPACGSPWRQVIERDRAPTRPGVESKVYEADESRKQDAIGKRTYVGFNARWKASQEVGNRDPQRHETAVRVVGWESSCTCIEPSPVPCTIFDPFGGAMTTLVAADALGRHGIATELNADYLALGADRLSRPHAPARKPATVTTKPMPLFRGRTDHDRG